MKTSIFIILFTAGSVTVFAKKKLINTRPGITVLPHHPTKEQWVSYGKQIAKDLQKTQSLSGLVTAKTTAISSRLIAAASHTVDGSSVVPFDTAHLSYSSDRGGDLSDEEWIKFDDLHEFEYDEDLAALRESSNTTRTYSSSNDILTGLDRYWDDASGSLVNDRRYFYRYTTATKPVSDSEQTWNGTAWENSDLIHSTYNATNDIISDTNFYWDGTSWQAFGVLAYTYTPANKVERLAILQYESSTGDWTEIFKTDYTYDAAGNLTEDLSQLLTPDLVWENSSRTTYTYDASNNRIGELQEEWNTSSSAWIGVFRSINAYDAAGNQTESIQQAWDAPTAAFRPISKTLSTYNTYKQVTTMTPNTWDESSSTWIVGPDDYKSFFYYEEFKPAKLNEIAKQGAIHIYPVPAQNELKLEINGAAQQLVTISLTDMQGRVLISQRANTSYSTVIPVISIPAGNYAIRVDGDKGLKVSKMISVVH